LNDVTTTLDSDAGFPEARRELGTKRSLLKGLLRKLTNYRVAAAATLGVVLGTLLLLLEAHTEGAVSRFVGELGATVLSVGLIVLVYELWLRRSIVAEFLGAAGLEADLAATGIREVREWGSIDWGAFFDECRGDIEIVVSYGRTWSATNAERVIQAAARNRSRVTITVLDPEAPGVLLDFYGETYGTNADGLRGRIRDVLDTWSAAANRSAEAGHLVAIRIEGLTRHTPYTFYRVGDSMWVIFSPRQPGRVGDDIPSILCRKVARGGPGLYDWVANDLEACRRKGYARVLWEAGQ